MGIEATWRQGSETEDLSLVRYGRSFTHDAHGDMKENQMLIMVVMGFFDAAVLRAEFYCSKGGTHERKVKKQERWDSDTWFLPSLCLKGGVSART